MSTPHDIPSHAHLHPSGVASATRPDTQIHEAAVHHTASDRGDPTPSQTQEHDPNQNPNAPEQGLAKSASPGGTEYPEQLHAGKVGYGPNYHQKPDIADKFTGLKEEVKGTILRKPELVQKGKDRITGELKKKEMEEDEKEDPFANPDEKREKGEKKEDKADPKDIEVPERTGPQKHYTQPVQPKAQS